MILSAVNPLTILWSILVLFVLAFVFGIVLAVLGKKLAVHEDERIRQVRDKLSGANCGGCGYAGCDAFAKAIVEGKADINACCATSADNKKLIAQIMGTSVSAEDTKIVVACCGGNNAQDKYEYMGYGDCKSMELLGGGRKQCKWGCLGMGSCVDACPYGAIQVGMDGYAEVDRTKCIRCGRCVSTCPKKLVRRIPADAKCTWLAPIVKRARKCARYARAAV
ncbi:MAG: 4Fe-4S binding protein [Christensenella sp.]|nr:MAG: 4Fe-4S binding protein [Christensenella sp.]